MMDQWQLSDEFDRLECLLASRPRPEPLPNLRERVLGEVRGELRCRRRSRRRRLAAAIAASLLVGVGLSLAVWQGTHHASRRPPLPSMSQVAEQIQARVPELSREESRRQAVLMTFSLQVGGQGKQDVLPSHLAVEPGQVVVAAPPPTSVSPDATKCGAALKEPPKPILKPK
jgi:hypothetical protein